MSTTIDVNGRTLVGAISAVLGGRVLRFTGATYGQTPGQRPHVALTGPNSTILGIAEQLMRHGPMDVHVFFVDPELGPQVEVLLAAAPDQGEGLTCRGRCRAIHRASGAPERATRRGRSSR